MPCAARPSTQLIAIFGGSGLRGPRRAELAFYGAILGLDPAAATAAGRHKLLEGVVAARVVLDAEYDLARRYLAQP